MRSNLAFISPCAHIAFSPLAGNVDLSALSDPAEVARVKAQINNFGQMPQQLMLQPHPARRSAPPPPALTAGLSASSSAASALLQLEGVPLALLPLDEARAYCAPSDHLRHPCRCILRRLWSRCSLPAYFGSCLLLLCLPSTNPSPPPSRPPPHPDRGQKPHRWTPLAPAPRAAPRYRFYLSAAILSSQSFLLSSPSNLTATTLPLTSRRTSTCSHPTLRRKELHPFHNS